jgi:hypothetical protein
MYLTNPRDKTRMIQWLLLSVAVYLIAALLAGMPAASDAGQLPRLQTVLWKVGHLNLAAYIGYWIDRHAYRDRVDLTSPYLMHIRRAIIIAASMIAFGLAL